MFSKLFTKKLPKTDDWFRSENWSKKDREFFELKLSKSRSTFHKAQYMKIKAIYMSSSNNPGIRKAARDLFKRVTEDYPKEDFSVIEAYYQLGKSYESDGNIKNAERYYRECIAYKKNLGRRSGIYVPVEQSLANLLAKSKDKEKKQEAKAIEEDLYTNKSLTKEEMDILRILSRNNKYQLQSLVKSSKERLDRILREYYQRQPIVEDLRNHGIIMSDLYDPRYPEFKDEWYEKAVPLLVEWLKKGSLSYNTRASIMHVLLEIPNSKKLTFDIVLDIYKTVDIKKKDDWGYHTQLPMMLGNAVMRWADDEHAESIFNLLQDKRLKENREDGWFLQGMTNFKKPENAKKAIDILVQRLDKSNLPNAELWTLLYCLRKLKAVEAREIIEPFTRFPGNYKRTIELDPKVYGYTSNGEVRAEAKKAIAKFDKIQAK